jgi:putative oxidoreductase
MLRDVREKPQVPLRIAVGLSLLYHSIPWVFTASGHANFVHMLETVGLPLPELSAWAVAGLEVVGGVALVIGLWVPVMAALVALEVLIRVSFITLMGAGFPQPLPGMPGLPDVETNLLWVGGLIALVIAGAGWYSVDWKEQTKKEAA